MKNFRYDRVHDREDERRILQCASCDATVVTKAVGLQERDGAVCVCGKTMTNSVPQGADYFDVVMKAGHGRPRLRRPR